MTQTTSTTFSTSENIIFNHDLFTTSVFPILGSASDGILRVYLDAFDENGDTWSLIAKNYNDEVELSWYLYLVREYKGTTRNVIIGMTQDVTTIKSMFYTAIKDFYSKPRV